MTPLMCRALLLSLAARPVFLEAPAEPCEAGDAGCEAAAQRGASLLQTQRGFPAFAAQGQSPGEEGVGAEQALVTVLAPELEYKGYRRLSGVAESEGESVAYIEKKKGRIDLDTCIRKCETTKGCKSFARSADGKGCWFKDRCILFSDTVRVHYVTHYRKPVKDEMTKIEPQKQRYGRKWVANPPLTEYISVKGVGKPEGTQLKQTEPSHTPYTVEQCGDICEETVNCNSFVRSSDGMHCWFKDKKKEEMDHLEPYYVTYYKPSDKPCPGQADSQVSKMWHVVHGPCTVDTSGCVMSPAQQQYGTKKYCEVLVDLRNAQTETIRVVKFQTAGESDYITLNGDKFWGVRGPSNQIPRTRLTWVTDGVGTDGVGRSEWKLCLRAPTWAPTPAPTPAPPTPAPAPTPAPTKGFSSLGGVAKDEGEPVTSHNWGHVGQHVRMHQDLESCKEQCDYHQDCKSFAFQADGYGCWLKKKCIQEDEAVVTHYVTYYKYCDQKGFDKFDGYKALPGVAVEEGDSTSWTDQIMGEKRTLADCENMCDRIQDCKSFAWSSDKTGCWYKKKCIQSTARGTYAPYYETYYKPCD